MREDEGQVLPPTPTCNMKLDEHLRDRLHSSGRYSLTDEENKTIKFQGLEEFIFKKLTSTKFRKTSLDPESAKQIREAIRLNLSRRQPIKFTYPFGGYKIWRVPTYPSVDWAEFFTLAFVTRYVAPVVNAYDPGAEIFFSSDDVVIEQIDNYPRAALDEYVDSFKSLLAQFTQYLPDNLHIKFVQVVPDIYSPAAYRRELQTLYRSLKTTGLSPDRQTKIRKGFDFNFMVKGKVDFSGRKTAMAKTIQDLIYYSDAYLQLAKRRDFVRGQDKIVIFSNKIPNAVDIGSTSVSKAKFWAGIGVVESAAGKYYERVMSPNQWEATRKWVRQETVDLIKGPNFSRIPVFDQRFDFLSNPSHLHHTSGV